MMRPNPVVVTPPTQEPITIADAKRQCRIAATLPDFDAELASLIQAVRVEAELYLNRALLTQTLRVLFDDWADVFWLPRAAPLQSVSSVTYYDAGGVQQTLATSYYLVDTDTEPGRVLRAPNQAWPALQSDRRGGIAITYMAGRTAPALVPANILNGIKVLVGGIFADPDNAIGQLEKSRSAAQQLWSERITDRPTLCVTSTR